MTNVLERLLEGIGLDNDFDAGEMFAGINKVELDAERREAQRQAAIVQACIKGPEGSAFMAWLAQKTILRPPNDAELTTLSAEAAALMAQRRVGMAQIFHMIVAAITMDTRDPNAPEAN